MSIKIYEIHTCLRQGCGLTFLKVQFLSHRVAGYCSAECMEKMRVNAAAKLEKTEPHRKEGNQ